jgi:hypothetical protein
MTRQFFYPFGRGIELIRPVDENAAVALDDDFVVLIDERYFCRDGTELSVTAGTENRFESIDVHDVMEGREFFGGLTVRGRKRLDDGLDERHLTVPRVLRRGDRFGGSLYYGVTHLPVL